MTRQPVKGWEDVPSTKNLINWTQIGKFRKGILLKFYQQYYIHFYFNLNAIILYKDHIFLEGLDWSEIPGSPCFITSIFKSCTHKRKRIIKIVRLCFTSYTRGAVIHPWMENRFGTWPETLSSSNHGSQSRRGSIMGSCQSLATYDKQETSHLSASRKRIYLGNDGETFNFLKPISCQHRWLNISWGGVWSGSGELPVRRFSRHSDWWGDISQAAVPPLCCNPIIHSPLYTAVRNACLARLLQGWKKKGEPRMP